MLTKLNSFRKPSFKRKLFFYSLIISLLPVFIIGFLSSRMAAVMIRDEVNRNHQFILQEVQRQVEAFWEDLDTASIQLANNPVLEKAVYAKSGPSAKSFDTMLEMVDTIQMQRSISKIPYDVSVFFLPYGKIYNNKLGFINLSDFPYRDLLDRLPPYFRSETISPGTYPGQRELLYLRPVPIFAESRGNGILMIHVEKDALSSFSENVPLSGGRLLYVFDDTGRVLISRNEKEIGTKLSHLSASLPLWQENRSDDLDTQWNGINYVVTMHQSDVTHWTYVALTPKNELDRQSKRIITLTYGMMALLALFSILIARVGAYRFYVPVQKLLQRFVPASASTSEGNKLDEWGTLDTWVTGMLSHNENLERKLHEQTPYMKENFALQLLRGGWSHREAEARAEELNLTLHDSKFCVCLLDPDSNLQTVYSKKDRSLIVYALRKMAEEFFQDSFTCLSAATLSGQVAVIVFLDKDDTALTSLHHTAECLLQAADQYFPVSISMACSSPVGLFADISEAYLEAEEMLTYRLLIGCRKLLTPERMEPGLKQSGSDLSKLRKRILPMVMQGEANEAAVLMQEWVAEVSQVASHPEAVLGFFAHFVGELQSHLQEWGLDPESIFGENPYKRIYAMTNVEEITRWLTDVIFVKVAEYILQSPAKQPERIVGDVVRYIQEYYDTDLSLQMMADRYQVSPSQLSRMFKEQTGLGFIDYLISYRMDKAKEWLAYTDMPIKDIARKLSYTSVQNFTRIFKQTVQIPPGEYRKLQQEGLSRKQHEQRNRP